MDSNLHMFVEDTKLNREMTYATDEATLQNDINEMEKCLNEWLIGFLLEST